MNHASLFTGIGGFDLAAHWMGWNNIFQCEIDKFCTRVLEKNFPDVRKYGDIKQTDFTIYRGKIDVLTGGFPCQPFSIAGKRKGTNDDRFLWPEMLRAIREIQPAWIVAENVSGLLTQGDGMVFEQVCFEMEKEGYEVQSLIIPACAINAPHRRDRIWFIAKNTIQDGYRFGGNDEQINIRNKWDIGARNDVGLYFKSNATYPDCKRQSNRYTVKGEIQDFKKRVQNHRKINGFNFKSGWHEVATEFCRVDDGISNRMDRLKSLGNAIVPQVAFEIFKAIELCETTYQKQ